MFFENAVKWFDKLWLKDCLLEMYNLWLEMYNLDYDQNTLKILYEINNAAYVIIRTAVGNTDDIQVKYLDPSCAVSKHPQLTAL